METSKIIITDVKEVKGFIHEGSIYAENPNRYNGNRLISRSYDPKALFIKGIVDGKEIQFYTPTVVVTVTEGFLNHKTMDKNSWFELVEGAQSSYRGAAMFDGGDTPNVAIVTECTILPKITKGDEITIRYAVNPNGRINRVKII